MNRRRVTLTHSLELFTHLSLSYLFGFCIIWAFVSFVWSQVIHTDPKPPLLPEQLTIKIIEGKRLGLEINCLTTSVEKFIQSNNLKTANALKEQANLKFQSRNIMDACKLYSRAIELLLNHK